MTHQNVLNLRDKLLKVKGLKGWELNFEIKTNILEINRIVEPLVEMEKEIQSILTKFNEERNALHIKNCTVDGVVKKKIVGGMEVYDVPLSKQVDNAKELGELMTKYKIDIDRYNKENTGFLKFLNEEESKFKISTVKKEHIPEDISTEDLDLIFDIIEKVYN